MSRLSSQTSLLRRLDSLLRDAATQVNLECRNGRWRIRYRQTDDSGKRRRRSIALPDDAMLLAEVRERIRRRRDGGGKRAAEAGKALRSLKRRMLAAADCGRWLRRRIGRMFDIAAGLGREMLDDYLDHKPWRAVGKPAGRPRTRDVWGQNDDFDRYF